MANQPRLVWVEQDKKLRDLMRISGVQTPEQLADYLGVSNATARRWLSGAKGANVQIVVSAFARRSAFAIPPSVDICSASELSDLIDEYLASPHADLAARDIEEAGFFFQIAQQLAYGPRKSRFIGSLAERYLYFQPYDRNGTRAFYQTPMVRQGRQDRFASYRVKTVRQANDYAFIFPYQTEATMVFFDTAKRRGPRVTTLTTPLSEGNLVDFFIGQTVSTDSTRGNAIYTTPVLVVRCVADISAFARTPDFFVSDESPLGLSLADFFNVSFDQFQPAGVFWTFENLIDQQEMAERVFETLNAQS